MTLYELCQHKIETDPEYRMLVDAVREGYVFLDRGEKNPFVMSIDGAKKFLSEVKQ